MKRYIKSATNYEWLEDSYLPELVDDGVITENEISDCMKINYGGITEEDVQIFLVCMTKLGIRPNQIKKVQYAIKQAESRDFDGGYEVTFNDGSSQLYGWYDNDTLRGAPKLYLIER